MNVQQAKSVLLSLYPVSHSLSTCAIQHIPVFRSAFPLLHPGGQALAGKQAAGPCRTRLCLINPKCFRVAAFLGRHRLPCHARWPGKATARFIRQSLAGLSPFPFRPILRFPSAECLGGSGTQCHPYGTAGSSACHAPFLPLAHAKRTAAGLSRALLPSFFPVQRLRPKNLRPIRSSSPSSPPSPPRPPAECPGASTGSRTGAPARSPGRSFRKAGSVSPRRPGPRRQPRGG